MDDSSLWSLELIPLLTLVMLMSFLLMFDLTQCFFLRALLCEVIHDACPCKSCRVHLSILQYASLSIDDIDFQFVQPIFCLVMIIFHIVCIVRWDENHYYSMHNTCYVYRCTSVFCQFALIQLKVLPSFLIFDSLSSFHFCSKYFSLQSKSLVFFFPNSLGLGVFFVRIRIIILLLLHLFLEQLFPIARVWIRQIVIQLRKRILDPNLRCQCLMLIRTALLDEYCYTRYQLFLTSSFVICKYKMNPYQLIFA